MLVFDPFAPACGRDLAGWRGGLVFNEWGAFKRAFWRSRGCLVIVDEAGDASSDHLADFRQMLTQGRHVASRPGLGTGGGHVVAMVAQRRPMVHPNLRNQASELVLFEQHREDAQDLAIEWNCDALREAPRLPTGHYIRLRKPGAPRRGVVRIPKKA